MTSSNNNSYPTWNGRMHSVLRTSRRRGRTPQPSRVPVGKHPHLRPPTMRQTCTDRRRPYSCGSGRSRFVFFFHSRPNYLDACAWRGERHRVAVATLRLSFFFLPVLLRHYICNPTSLFLFLFFFFFFVLTPGPPPPPATLCLHTYEDGHRTFSSLALSLSLLLFPPLLSFLSSRQLFMIPSPYPDCIPTLSGCRVAA